jgi:hypothetical protein
MGLEITVRPTIKNGIFWWGYNGMEQKPCDIWGFSERDLPYKFTIK